MMYGMTVGAANAAANAAAAAAAKAAANAAAVSMGLRAVSQTQLPVDKKTIKATSASWPDTHALWSNLHATSPNDNLTDIQTFISEIHTLIAGMVSNEADMAGQLVGITDSISTFIVNNQVHGTPTFLDGKTVGHLVSASPDDILKILNELGRKISNGDTLFLKPEATQASTLATATQQIISNSTIPTKTSMSGTPPPQSLTSLWESLEATSPNHELKGIQDFITTIKELITGMGTDAEMTGVLVGITDSISTFIGSNQVHGTPTFLDGKTVGNFNSASPKEMEGILRVLANKIINNQPLFKPADLSSPAGSAAPTSQSVSTPPPEVGSPAGNSSQAPTSPEVSAPAVSAANISATAAPPPAGSAVGSSAATAVPTVPAAADNQTAANNQTAAPAVSAANISATAAPPPAVSAPAVSAANISATAAPPPAVSAPAVSGSPAGSAVGSSEKEEGITTQAPTSPPPPAGSAVGSSEKEEGITTQAPTSPAETAVPTVPPAPTSSKQAAPTSPAGSATAVPPAPTNTPAPGSSAKAAATTTENAACASLAAASNFKDGTISFIEQTQQNIIDQIQTFCNVEAQEARNIYSVIHMLLNYSVTQCKQDTPEGTGHSTSVLRSVLNTAAKQLNITGTVGQIIPDKILEDTMASIIGIWQSFVMGIYNCMQAHGLMTTGTPPDTNRSDVAGTHSAKETFENLTKEFLNASTKVLNESQAMIKASIANYTEKGSDSIDSTQPLSIRDGDTLPIAPIVGGVAGGIALLLIAGWAVNRYKDVLLPAGVPVGAINRNQARVDLVIDNPEAPE